MRKRPGFGKKRPRPFRAVGMKRKIQRVIGICKANFVARTREDPRLHSRQKAALINRADYIVRGLVRRMIFGAV